MASFRFRAQVALDLRRKQEDLASEALARAEAAFREAKAQEIAAMADRQAACDARQTAERSGIGAAALEWHWNWINRLAAGIALRVRDAAAREADVAAAERAWHEARRRRRALERIRDRALRRHQQAEARKDEKAVDELARLRFVMPHAGSGGTHHDD